jgi:DNA mismatch repair protein MutS
MPLELSKTKMNKPVKMTPMLRQYMEIKEQYPDTILFYRMGDFYEMFLDDAVIASKILGITLTSRSAKEEANKVPMCGIPFHAIANYLGKLIKAGYRVAVCEQVEDPKEAKGIVKREVVRVVTPGVTTDEQLLDEKSNTFVAAICQNGRGKKMTAGLAFLDVSTGNFLINEIVYTPNNYNEIIDALTLMKPAEILVSEQDKKNIAPLLELISTIMEGVCLTFRGDIDFDMDTASLTLTEHFKTTNLAGFGCDNLRAGIRAAGGLLAYIQETQKTEISYIRRISLLDKTNSMGIDESSRRNLELTETITGGKREGSLLFVIDMTCTPMGARFLKKQILFPLQKKDEIISRLSAVESLLLDHPLLNNIRFILDEIYDLERLCSRLVLGQGNARDMNSLGISLAGLPELKKLLIASPPGLVSDTGRELDELSDIYELINNGIRDDAPIHLREGKLIKEGFHEELDELIILLRDGKKLIASLEAKERKRTGNPKLKVGYNRVFGYFFEVSRAQSATIPDDFIRKQTLVNAERFISPELKELENKISSAQEKRLELEHRLFIEIRQKISSEAERLLNCASVIARIDFLTCLARVAQKYHYIRPAINDEQVITIEEGRHPVIERTIEAGRFVANDIHLDHDKQQLLLITGPNMAGKSTVLRQTALIVLMAHIGSFVPAVKADICLIDRIFTRVGAMDNLRRGQSTFMVEMNETANILHNATENSLVILDEIGRGTSTYDGLAIAWSVAEELVSKEGRGIKTLFATHYHELTALAATHKRVRNFSIAVREWEDSIIFLHKLIEGATNRSYGIQVAELAGVPRRVIKRAMEILKQIENEGAVSPEIVGYGQDKVRHPYQMDLFSLPDKDPVKELLSGVDPNKTSPMEALNLLYEIKKITNGL